MAVTIKFDETHNVVSPTFVLATRNGKKLGVIPAINIIISDNFKSQFDLKFDVYKYTNNKKYMLWDKLVDFVLVWCKEWDIWFEAYVTTQETTHTLKTISCVSLGEAELSQVHLYDTEINTEDDIARDDYEPTVLYDESNANASLLSRIMEKVPHYSIEFVDQSIATIQRTFSFDNITLYDAFQEIAEEIDCIFIIHSNSREDGSINRSISVYDLESHCNDCGKRGLFDFVCPECGSTNIGQGYGKDSTIFISSDNLADDISLEVDTGSVKNCFRLECGDDLMTATVKNCNPNGTSYIWNISDETKEDMSNDLVNRLSDYDISYKYYNEEYNVLFDPLLVSQYNELVLTYGQPDVEDEDERYSTIPPSIVGFPNLIKLYYDTINFYLYLHDEMMPKIELDTNDSEIFIPYQVSGEATKIDGKSAEEYAAMIKQKLNSTLNKESDKKDIVGIKSLFSLDIGIGAFQLELQKYSLVSLESIHDSCEACVNLLIEQGIADNKTWGEGSNIDLYDSVYLPYYERLAVIDSEIKKRENELETIEEMQDEIERQRGLIQDALNLEKYLGTELWLEFVAYRREDVYQNENYISDGLSNADLIESAQKFLEIAKSEIIKASTHKHSLSSTLQNLLVMKEFSPIVDYFAVGNWIRVRVNDTIFKLRLTSYTIDFSNLENITVEFSDVTKFSDSISKSVDIISKTSAMASSYGGVTRQAALGEKSDKKINDWHQNGMSLYDTKIVNDSDEENLVYNRHGLTFREYDSDDNNYENQQLKVINKGLFFTDESWETSKAAIGFVPYTYTNPEEPDQKETKFAYGVNGEIIVGKILLGEALKITNETSTLTFDKDGLLVKGSETENSGSVSINPNDAYIFKIDNGEKIALSFNKETKTLFVSGNINAESLTLGDGVTIAYDKITGTPILSDVALTGDYSSLTGTPNLSDVALTGDYSSLTGTPDPISISNEIYPSSSALVDGGTIYSFVTAYAVKLNQGTDNTGKLLYIGNSGNVELLSIDDLKQMLN